MAESKVNRDNFIVIQGFMITDLKLKGNELIIYACIYGFSQAENQVFSGSLQYLADWTNSTKQGVMKSLKSLVDKGYITKTDKYINGVKFCEYSATKFNGGMQQSLIGGMQQSLNNNIGIENISNNIESKKASKKSFDDILAEYSKGDADIQDLLGEWLKVRKAKRAPLTDRAIQMNIAKLDNFAAQSGLSVKEYLQEVICRGWAAFYVINNYNNKSVNKNVGANGITISNEKSDLDAVL